MLVNLPEKRYYKIGEVAKAFDVKTSLVRFWEKEFEIIRPKKNAKGNRMFTQEDVKNFQMIHHLVKEKGFTLEGAKKKIKNNPTKTVLNHEIISRLETVKASLLKIRDQL